ncbi:ferredoxin--NADP(+) reductase [Ventosimonas gracilis]|uniref:ferredoxin--NADP(+) reductase n=1 Tax=Ventosimonas gracilis TaxID=1680762 RepID=A0A139SWE9_9GAMM|nr:ferredoxin--NADP reductase [Ventosimonas gracilis]KXU38945.1 ferredoxin--NADP(+) reductase [Ventosimonas gracilis]
MNAEKFTRQPITAIHPLTANLFSFRTERDAAFRFQAGQFARLGVQKADGSLVWRAYSMVSAPHDEFLEFFSIVVPNGEFTGELSRLRLGDHLLIDKQAFGFLTLNRFADGEDLWLLATGTGLAPFLSILQDFEVWQRFNRIVLVYSVREAAELAYQPMIADLARRDYLAEYASKLRYIPIITREHHSGTLHQRIPVLLKSGELEQAAGFALSAEQSRLMLCGNPKMVEDCRAVLKERGMRLALTRKPGQIAVENYW